MWQVVKGHITHSRTEILRDCDAVRHVGQVARLQARETPAQAEICIQSFFW